METTSVSDGAVLYEVMRHAEWRIKAAFPLLCRQCLQQSRQQSHWDFLARCLQADFLLHVPAITGLVTRELFLELWLTRHLFVPTAPRGRLLLPSCSLETTMPSCSLEAMMLRRRRP